MPVQEDIFKGATRPAMKFGIPLVPLVVIFGLTMLVILWGGTLVSWWIAPLVLGGVIPVLVWMRLVTKKDDQRLRQMFLRIKLAAAQRNRKFWHARTYAPVQWKGMKDAYRR